VSTPDPAFDEAAARRVLLLQALEAEPAAAASPWQPDDALWASRLARETLPARADAAQFIAERARHAWERLRLRDTALADLAAARPWRAAWVAAALMLGAVAGLAVDAIGSAQRINLLAPPLWGVLAWNLAVCLSLLLPWPHGPHGPHGPRTWLAQRLAGTGASGSATSRFRRAWAQAAAPLLAARAALLLHSAAAALALGLIAGLYLRGLVLDYRAGWQSTFLDAGQVHAVLAWLLAPAAAVTGIAVPGAAALQALRVAPEMLPAASAAPWIHLFAATLALAVVLPRALLAVAAWRRAAQLSRALVLPLHEPYFQRLLRARQGGVGWVQVLPCTVAPAPQAVQALREQLAASLGDAAAWSVADPLPLDSDDPALPAAPPGPGCRVLLVDLAATPEAETHGRLLQAVQTAAQQAAGQPLLLVADAAAFTRRFASLPQRVQERTALWRAFAAGQGVDFESLVL
jgi:hypothetical protein